MIKLSHIRRQKNKPLKTGQTRRRNFVFPPNKLAMIAVCLAVSTGLAYYWTYKSLKSPTSPPIITPSGAGLRLYVSDRYNDTNPSTPPLPLPNNFTDKTVPDFDDFHPMKLELNNNKLQLFRIEAEIRYH